MLKVAYGQWLHSLISLAFTELSNVVLEAISVQYANFSLPWSHVQDPKVLAWTLSACTPTDAEDWRRTRLHCLKNLVHLAMKPNIPQQCSLYRHCHVYARNGSPFLSPTSRRAFSWGFPVEVLPRPQWSAFLDIQEQRNTSSIVHSLWRSRPVTDCEFNKTIETESLFKKELLPS